MLREILSILMELPYPYCFDEAKKKLEKTWCIINGDLYYIVSFEGALDDKDSILHVETINNEGKHKTLTNIISFSFFLPKAGVYKYEEDVFILEKNPFKQWRKSYNDSSYSIYTLTQLHATSSDVYKIFKGSRLPRGIWREGNRIRMYTDVIGYFREDGTIEVKNSLFDQEIYEFCKEKDNEAGYIKESSGLS